MILRRIIGHFRKQEWTAIAIDFVIVVVGVFIGLQAQEWSKRQDDRRRESQIVEDLLADLDIDRDQYATAMIIDMRRISAADASLVGAGLPPIEFEWEAPETDLVSYSFDPSDAPAFPADKRDRIWTSASAGYFPTPSTSTYDAMVGSGEIKIIRDRDIVREIQIYKNLTGSVILQNDKLLRLREEFLHLGASYGLAPYAATPAADYFRLVANEPQLAAAIRIQATFTIFHHNEIRSADARAAALQERLKAYLENKE